MVAFRFNFLTFASSNKKELMIMMMRTFITLLLMAAFITAEAQQVMRKEKDGTYVVNTTTIANDVDGYAGPTPVEVYIKKNKIVKVVPLKTMDGPKYVAKVKNQMLTKYEGMKIDKKNPLPKVDGVTGATFTSDAVRENVKRAVEYYLKHK
jgi:electron transport complex protein RnfG